MNEFRVTEQDGVLIMQVPYEEEPQLYKQDEEADYYYTPTVEDDMSRVISMAHELQRLNSGKTVVAKLGNKACYIVNGEQPLNFDKVDKLT